MKPEQSSWHYIDPEKAPVFNTRLAKKLVSKRIIVAYTYMKPNGTIDRQEQHQGIVTVADSRSGIVVREHSTAKMLVLPPDLRSIRPAQKGTYQLRSSGEVVNNPDYLSDWIIEPTNNQPMPGPRQPGTSSTGYSLYGVGTMLYGRDDKRPDGSYIATKWIVFFFLPIYPLASFRIRRISDAYTIGNGRSSSHYAEPVSLNKGQIFATYLVGCIALALFIFAVTR